MIELMFTMFFYVIPLATFALFVVSLIAYIVAKRANKRVPGTFSHKQIRIRKILLIISSVIAAVFIFVFISLISLLTTAITLM